MIREYQPGDQETLVDIWVRASQVATPFLGDFIEAEKDTIRQVYLPTALTFVYELKGSVVGFISLLDSEVGALFAYPEHHGSGLGRALMDHAVSLRGAVFLDVFKANTIGRRFYDRYGFVLEREHVHQETGNTMLRLRFDG